MLKQQSNNKTFLCLHVIPKRALIAKAYRAEQEKKDNGVGAEGMKKI